MVNKNHIISLVLSIVFFAGCAESMETVQSEFPEHANLPVPTKGQYQWHEQERIMFVCLDPATWQGREYG